MLSHLDYRICVTHQLIFGLRRMGTRNSPLDRRIPLSLIFVRTGRKRTFYYPCLGSFKFFICTHISLAFIFLSGGDLSNDARRDRIWPASLNEDVRKRFFRFLLQAFFLMHRLATLCPVDSRRASQERLTQNMPHFLVGYHL